MSGFSKLAGSLGLGAVQTDSTRSGLPNASPGNGFETFERFLANEATSPRPVERSASSGSGFAALGALLPEPSGLAAIGAPEFVPPTDQMVGLGRSGDAGRGRPVG